jgi:broad specificity phosphatase PhoE
MPFPLAQERQVAEVSQQYVQRLWLVRHGATAWNLEQRFVGRSDVPLAPLGHSQTHWVGRRLRLEHIRTIYSSDLQRAYETATVIAQHCSLQRPIIVSPAWREMSFGEWEGLTYAQIAEQYQDHLDFFSNPVEHVPPGGEPFSQFVQRVRAAFAQLAQDAAEETDPTKNLSGNYTEPASTQGPHQDGRVSANQGDIVLISHAGTLRALLCSLLKIPFKHQWQLRIDHGSLSAIDFLPTAENIAATVSLALLNVQPSAYPEDYIHEEQCESYQDDNPKQ